MIQHLDMIKCAKKVKRFEKGDIIMQEGDPSGAQMYILIKGSISAYEGWHKPTEKLVATYNAGEFFGEESLFLGNPPSVTLIANEGIISLPINRENYMTFFAEQPDATFFFIEQIFRRFLGLGEIKHEVKALQPRSTTAKALLPKTEAPANAAPAKPAKAAPEPVRSSLFPPGHKNYKLEIISPTSEFLFMKTYTCPICGTEFKFQAVRSSRLIADHTDTDLRVHYKGVEPLHYDVVTCPTCWYSAMADMFKDCNSNRADVDRLLTEHRRQLPLRLDENRDSMSIFAGYYLALLCASRLFRNSEANIGKLWMKVSRLYDDCEDEAMSLYAAEQALKSYMSAYERSSTTGKQNQQLFYIIGELSMRMNDLSTARKFFFQAKTDRTGSPMITRHAEDRIEYLRELTKNQDEE